MGGNGGAPWVDSHGFPIPHYFQCIGGSVGNGELGNSALTKTVHIWEQLAWKTWISPTHEADEREVSD